MITYGILNGPLGLGALLFCALVAALPAFAIVALLGGPLIAQLRRLEARQTAYEDAPASHGRKSGTPTMGGIVFIVALLIALLFDHGRDAVALVALTLMCMAIGAIDDVAKIQGRRNRGLGAVPKFGLTICAAVAFLAIAGPQPSYLIGVGPVPVWVWYALSVCVVAATTHAVNLTDGLDGLAGSTILPPLVVLICVAGIARAPLSIPVFAAAIGGAVVGFLIFNRHPAKVFMGDTGSLALGGALAGVTILTEAQLPLLIIGGVFVAEALSVIIQVASFKATGKRVFRMSPLHHHFELEGWPEQKVTRRFWIASAVLSLIGFSLMLRPV
jgi:phospho-N-acetylmuramoyl-pentapeptide-transferase